MAIKGDVLIFGEVPVAGAYVRVGGAAIRKAGDAWHLTYEVEVYRNQATTDFSNPVRLPAPNLDRFNIAYDLETTDNPIALAYTDLKARALIANAEDV